MPGFTLPGQRLLALHSPHWKPDRVRNGSQRSFNTDVRPMGVEQLLKRADAVLDSVPPTPIYVYLSSPIWLESC